MFVSVMTTGGASKDLIDEFGDKIEDELKSGRFSNYNSGSEIPFINETVDLLDGVYAYDGKQVLNVKCKKAHSSPMVVYPGLEEYGKQKVELADILFVFNFWEDATVSHRQAFFTQSKCMKGKKTGYLWWDIDMSQYELLHKRPSFELEHKDADKTHDLSSATGSFFNYSFVSDVHRPFFYKTTDMFEYMDESYSKPRFYYGQNQPFANRYMYSTLKNSIRNRYGARFARRDPEYKLIEEVYEQASLKRSQTPNEIATDGGRSQTEFAIVNVDIDTDGSIVNLDDSFRPDINFESELSEGLEADIRGTIQNSFRGIDSKGLDFDSV